MRPLGVYSSLISCLAALLFLIYISFEHAPEALNPLNTFAMDEHYHHVKEDDQTFAICQFFLLYTIYRPTFKNWLGTGPK